MKNSITHIMLFAALLTLSACGDKKIDAKDVPAPVVASFNAKYAGATDVTWKTEKEDGKMVYEACFKTDKKREAHFDADGNFVKEE